MSREQALISRFGEGWYNVLKGMLDKPEVIDVANKVSMIRETHLTYPAAEDVFAAFKATPPEKTKVVIVGQDPYHDGINATGKAFECGGRKYGKQRDVTPSWDKVLKAYDQQYPVSFATDLYMGDLDRWALYGVLLLNSALTVEKGKPGSHQGIWEPFMRELMIILGNSQRPKFFIFLGRKAQPFQRYIRKPHTAIYREHPAAAIYDDRDWEHGDCFLVANQFLKETGQEQIDW